MVEYHRRGGLRRWALILGLIGASAAGFVIWFMFSFARGRMDPPAGWLFVPLPLIGVAIAFRWPLAGGILLILGGSALIVQLGAALLIIRTGFLGIQSGSISWWMLLVPIVAGLLLLASGVLFLISRTRQKRVAV